MLRLWVLDATLEEGEVWLWCKDSEGVLHVVKSSYRPSFYLIPPDSSTEIKGLNVEYESVKAKLMGRPVQAYRIYSKIGEVEKLASRVRSRVGGEVYEDDVRESVKFLIERDIKPCGWVEVEGREFTENKVRFVEAEKIKPIRHESPPTLKTLAFNPTYFTDKGTPKPEKDPVRLISISTSDGRSTVIEGDERKILEDFVKLVEGYDPDIIVGFGSNREQWSYLSQRAKLAGVSLNVGRLGAEPRTSLHGHISVRGRLNIDLEDMARDIPELTLGTLEEFIEYIGVERRIKAIEDYEMMEYWEENPGKVRDYSRQRAEAILEAFNLLRDFIFNLSELTGMPADYVLTASTGFRVENYLMYLAYKEGEIIPKRREVGHVSYPGGLVKAPKPGLHRDVAVIDFRSMYPSIMIKYNVSFDTLSPDGDNISPAGHRFKKAPEGFLPKALRTLLEERRRIQERLRSLGEGSPEAKILDARQRAVKLIANAIYGYTGWVGARWYSREVAEATAAWGRKMISESIRKAEQLGMKVIYSDTDSLFLVNHKNKIDKLINWIEQGLRLEAKLEKIYRLIVFTEAKKKYAGITQEGKIEIAGLEAVRGDWSKAARNAQREVIEALLKTGRINEAVAAARRHILRVIRRQLPVKDLVIWKQITRPLHEYAATQPHIAVAKRLVEEGWKIQPGDKVGFVVVSGTGPLYQRAKTYFEVQPDEVDWDYYLEKQVMAACMRVLEPLGVREEQLKASETSLTDFF